MATYDRRKQYQVDDGAKKYDRQKEEKYEADILSPISPVRPPSFFKEKEYEEERRQKETKVMAHALLPRLEEDQPIESLKRVSPEIIGSLFDRVQFLEQRIQELNHSMQTREQLHKQMIDEIDKDIDEKQAMIRSISDMDEQRNLKLDISVLRREKRREHVQFWRDLLELRTELRELTEEHQVESKIASLFRDLKSQPAENREERKW